MYLNLFKRKTIFNFIFIFSIALTLIFISNVKAKASSTTLSPFTKTTFTQQDVKDGKKIIHGIDVSFYQKTIDWEKAKAAGVEYAIIRLGYRTSSDGVLNMDTMYETNMKNAAAAGVRTGVYFFTQAVNETEAVEEATYCIQHLKGFTVNMPVAIDFESVGGGGRMYNAKLTTEKYTKIVSAFCDTIKGAGYTPMVYSSLSEFCYRLDGKALAEKYKIWLAHYATQTTCTHHYDFWQYSSQGSIDGITGNVDCNFFYTDTDLSEAVTTVVSSQAAVTATTSIEGASVSISNEYYTGEKITPTIQIKVNGTTLTKDKDYSVTFTNNVDPGIATVVITGINNYTGTLNTSFVIKPAKLAKFKAKWDSEEEVMNLSWGMASGATGFQIQKKLTYNGSYSLMADVTESQVYSYVDEEVTPTREYYYRIRGYIVVDGTKYFSPFYKLTGTAFTKTMIKSKVTAKIRKKPAKGKVLATVPAGKKLKVLGIAYMKNKTSGYHVIYKYKGTKIEGYISTAVVIM